MASLNVQADVDSNNEPVGDVNAPIKNSLTPEEEKQYRKATSGQAAAPRTERPNIPLGTPLSPPPIVGAAERPYHPSPTFNVGVLEGNPGMERARGRGAWRYRCDRRCADRAHPDR